jgi:hypothetical protein
MGEWEERGRNPQISSLVLIGFHTGMCLFSKHRKRVTTMATTSFSFPRAGYHTILAFGHHARHRVFMNYFSLRKSKDNKTIGLNQVKDIVYRNP